MSPWATREFPVEWCTSSRTTCASRSWRTSPHSMHGRTSRPSPATSSSAGSKTPSRRRHGNGAFAGPRRSSRRASVGRAAGRGARTASETGVNPLCRSTVVFELLSSSLREAATNQLVVFVTSRHGYRSPSHRTLGTKEEQERAMQGPRHDPHITHHADGHWVIRCPQCEQSRGASMPIGIAMPIKSHEVTELMLDNHLRREGMRPHRKIA